MVHYRKIIGKLVLLYELKRARRILLGSSICTHNLEGRSRGFLEDLAEKM